MTTNVARVAMTTRNTIGLIYASSPRRITGIEFDQAQEEIAIAKPIVIPTKKVK
jgi:hypothetical protein